MGPDEWPPLALVVPDDISELDADVAAYHRELRRGSKRPVLRRYGVVRPLLVLLLAVLAMTGTGIALLAPTPTPYARPQPLATTAVPAGSTGGLLPDVTLVVDGKQVSARDLRPALLFTVPAGCGCAPLVRALLGQTAQYSLRLVLVDHGLSATELRAARDAALGRATVVTDDDGLLAAAYGTGSLVFVHADGLVDSVVRDPTATARYELPLSQLTTPRGATSHRA